MKLKKFITVQDHTNRASLFLWEIEPALKEPKEYGLLCKEIMIAHNGDDFVKNKISCLLTFENEMSEN